MTRSARPSLLATLRRYLAVLLVAAGLQALALPVLAAPDEPDCEHCGQQLASDPCGMTAGVPAEADAPAAPARGQPPLPAAPRPALVLPSPEAALSAAATAAESRALRPGARGDPPRHLAVGRLLI